MLNRWASILSLFIAFPGLCWADLPLTVEDLLTEKNEFRLEFGLNYINSDRNNIGTEGDFVLVQTGDDSFSLLPVTNEQRRNNDILAMILGLRYGVTANTELYTRLTGTADFVRTQNDTTTDSDSTQQWNDLVIGVNHQFSPDNDTPALLGFAEIAVVENTATDGSDFVYGKTGQIGFTTYRTVDPGVLSLTAGYRYAARRDVSNFKVDPGDLIFLSPSLGFAINDQLTITGGVQFLFRRKDRVEGNDVGIRTSQTDLTLGVGYAPSENLTLYFDIRANISGNSGAQAGFNLLYKLGN